ncbi:MAG: cytochrome c maturation protein CcmE [Polyangiaceae bacterium]
MSKLDDELARAISEEPNLAPAKAPEAPPPLAPERAPSSSTRNFGLLAALVGIVGMIVLVFMFGFKDAAIYSLPVAELTSNQAKYVGRKVRVEGELTPGTLKKRDQPCEYRFDVQTMGAAYDSNTVKVPVRYGQCVVPDTFRDMPGGGVQVTIEGSLTKEGYFEATLVMAKCSSKYDPSTHQMGKDKKSDPTTPIN